MIKKPLLDRTWVSYGLAHPFFCGAGGREGGNWARHPAQALQIRRHQLRPRSSTSLVAANLAGKFFGFGAAPAVPDCVDAEFSVTCGTFPAVAGHGIFPAGAGNFRAGAGKFPAGQGNPPVAPLFIGTVSSRRPRSADCSPRCGRDTMHGDIVAPRRQSGEHSAMLFCPETGSMHLQDWIGTIARACTSLGRC